MWSQESRVRSPSSTLTPKYSEKDAWPAGPPGVTHQAIIDRITAAIEAAASGDPMAVVQMVAALGEALELFQEPVAVEATRSAR